MSKSVYLNSECYLYTSFTSNYNCSLIHGRYNLLLIWPLTRNDIPKLEMRYLDLSPRRLVTYFKVPFRDYLNKEIERIKTLVALTRAVFVIRLRAIRGSSKLPIKDLVP